MIITNFLTNVCSSIIFSFSIFRFSSSTFLTASLVTASCSFSSSSVLIRSLNVDISYIDTWFVYLLCKLSNFLYDNNIYVNLSFQLTFSKCSSSSCTNVSSKCRIFVRFFWNIKFISIYISFQIKEPSPSKRSWLTQTKDWMLPARALGWKPSNRAGISQSWPIKRWRILL